jgi:hypothetical protein
MGQNVADISEQDVATLSRYLDGEMPPAEARQLEQRLDADAELRLGLVKLEELNRRLRDVFRESAGVPPSVSALLEQAVIDRQADAPIGTDAPARAEPAPGASDANVLPFPKRSVSVATRRWTGALAASLVFALAVGLGVKLDDAPGNSLPGNDRLVSEALDRQPSGDGWARLADGRELQPVLTFPHHDGNWCREYLLRGGKADWRAVACREGDRWVTQAAGLESYIDGGSEYRPAGSGDAEPVAVFISQHAADIALDREAEAELLAEWK